jgi:hypothetical protein
MIILTEGVHQGSQGPLYYPKEELGKTPVVWNHKPIVVYHPTMNGEGISACDPVIINNRKVGLMMNTKFEGGRLRSEAWIEKDRADVVDNRITAAIDNKEMMELSTGVFVDVEETTGTWKGEDYAGIARNYRPDHLALLPDQVGACSIADGAGFLRNNAFNDNPASKAMRKALIKMGVLDNEMSASNIHSALSTAVRKKFNVGDDGPFIWIADVYSNFFIYEKDGKLWRLGYTANDSGVSLGDETPVEVTRVTEYRTVKEGSFVGNQQNNEEPPMNKKEQVDAIIASNTGWKETDRPVLMNLGDDQLKQIQGGIKVVPPAPTPKAKEKIDALIAANVGLTEADRPQLNAFTEEQLARISIAKSPAPAAPAATTAPATTAATTNAPSAPVTVGDYIKSAPPQIQEVLNNGISVYNEEKNKLIGVILKNENNGYTKEELESKPLNELRNLCRLAAPKADTQQPAPYYGGQAPVSVGNEAEEALVMPVINFGK